MMQKINTGIGYTWGTEWMLLNIKEQSLAHYTSEYEGKIVDTYLHAYSYYIKLR